MERDNTDFSELKNVNYELFLVGLMVLSIINIPLALLAPTLQMRQIVWIVDASLCIIFIGDFIYRLATAKSKSGYMLRQYGWLDLLGSLPLPILRLLRIMRAVRTIRLLQVYGSVNMQSELRQDRAGSTLLSVAFLGILVLEFGSYFILGAEAASTNANIHTPSDALWWSIVTIATIGYGVKYPVTNEGRIIGIFVIITGVGLFSAFTGFLANTFISRQKRRRRLGAKFNFQAEDPLDEIREILKQQAQLLASIESRLPPLPNSRGDLPVQSGDPDSKVDPPS